MIDLNALMGKASEEGIAISQKQAQIMGRFTELLLLYNEKFNITGILNEEDIILKHIVDSVYLTKLVDFKEGEVVVDIGAGGGFPSTPIVILKEGIRAVQVEASGKKAAFLETAADTLNLSDRLRVYNIRAEEMGRRAEDREKYDCVVARAVAKLAVLVELGGPLLKEGGYLYAMKGNLRDELEQARPIIKKVGMEIEEVKNYKLGGIYERSLVMLKKISQTPSIYPRNYSKIIKSLTKNSKL